MEIDIFSVINFQFSNHQLLEIERSKKNNSGLYSNYPENYISEEIQKIDDYFTVLNNIHFNFEEYLTPLYIHFIEIDTLEKIADNLYSIEKKRNQYLTIEKFKERVFGNLKYQLNYFLENKDFRVIQWVNDDCYYIRERIELENSDVLLHQKILIFDEKLSDENIIIDYFDALIQFIETFNPSKNSAKNIAMKIATNRRYFNTFYYSFSDFIANYDNIYNSWLEDHPEGYELKFIEDITNISNLKFVKKELLKENGNLINIEFIPVFKNHHIVYLTINEFADFIKEKIKTHQKNFNITFTNKDVIGFDIEDYIKTQNKRLELTFEVYELRNGKFDFFDFAGNCYIYSILMEGNETYVEKTTFIDLAPILKPLYSNNDNYDVMIDFPTLTNYQHSVTKINDFLLKRVQSLKETNTEFGISNNIEQYNFNKGTTIEDLSYNINLYFELLVKIVNWLVPISKQSDIIYLNNNYFEIDNIYKSIKKSNFKQYFVLYNQIQNSEKFYDYISHLDVLTDNLIIKWSGHYNEKTFKNAENQNLFWNESNYKSMIYQIDGDLKDTKETLASYRKKINKSSNSNEDNRLTDIILDYKSVELEEISKRYEEQNININTGSLEKVKSSNPKRLSAPVIIAMLKELGVLAKFTQKGYNRQAIIDTLYQIIGTNKTNIGKYYDSMIAKDNSDFKSEHIETAKDFLNSKGL